MDINAIVLSLHSKGVSLDTILKLLNGNTKPAPGLQVGPGVAGPNARQYRLSPPRPAYITKADVSAATRASNRTLDQIVELLKRHPDGLRAEQIREALGMHSQFWKKLQCTTAFLTRIKHRGPPSRFGRYYFVA